MPATLQPNIIGLKLGLREFGKIKIGIKGHTRKSSGGKEFQPPEKIDHFIVTTLERDDTGNFKRDEDIHASLGDKPTRIPITLVFDDINLNFQSRYVCFRGTTQWCTGDGKRANRQGVKDIIPCTCERAEQDYKGQERCKMSGVLSVMIRDMKRFGGVYKFRTTSFNSIQSIYSALHAIQSVTGGPLAGIDLDLTVTPKTATTPDGKTQTIYVVSVEYPGSMLELRQGALQLAQGNTEYRRQLESAEKAARENMPEDIIPADEAEEFVEEFVPEQADGYEPPAPPAEIDLTPPVRKAAKPAPVNVDTETGEVEPDDDDRQAATPAAPAPKQAPIELF